MSHLSLSYSSPWVTKVLKESILPDISIKPYIRPLQADRLLHFHVPCCSILMQRDFLWLDKKKERGRVETNQNDHQRPNKEKCMFVWVLGSKKLLQNVLPADTLFCPIWLHNIVYRVSSQINKPLKYLCCTRPTSMNKNYIHGYIWIVFLPISISRKLYIRSVTSQTNYFYCVLFTFCVTTLRLFTFCYILFDICISGLSE